MHITVCSTSFHLESLQQVLEFGMAAAEKAFRDLENKGKMFGLKNIRENHVIFLNDPFSVRFRNSEKYLSSR